ncbi:MAG: GNAT family N-acetyltransferase, partial [Alphaproteobacteria bacterium]|nr:GNAT family N-acetyltransferase [Alphaproteobacteria bacterium]
MTVAIETIGAGDVEAIALLHAASFDDAWGAPMIQRVLAMPGSFGLLARAEDGTLAGFALGRTVADECELLSLAVAPARRGHGLG